MAVHWKDSPHIESYNGCSPTKGCLGTDAPWGVRRAKQRMQVGEAINWKIGASKITQLSPSLPNHLIPSEYQNIYR